MSPRLRAALIIIAVLLLALSVLALVYAWLPAPISSEQIRVAPTLLSPPGGLP